MTSGDACSPGPPGAGLRSRAWTPTWPPSWDAEYAAGRYSRDAPVGFIRDVLAAARQRGLRRGLYVGCGNGRNLVPMVDAGLDLTGLDISAEAIANSAAGGPTSAAS